jgi:hypothetical protein
MLVGQEGRSAGFFRRSETFCNLIKAYEIAADLNPCARSRSEPSDSAKVSVKLVERSMTMTVLTEAWAGGAKRGSRQVLHGKASA